MIKGQLVVPVCGLRDYGQQGLHLTTATATSSTRSNTQRQTLPQWQPRDIKQAKHTTHQDISHYACQVARDRRIALWLVVREGFAAFDPESWDWWLSRICQSDSWDVFWASLVRSWNLARFRFFSNLVPRYPISSLHADSFNQALPGITDVASRAAQSCYRVSLASESIDWWLINWSIIELCISEPYRLAQME